MNAQPFLVGVNAAGLPRRFLTQNWRGDENLQCLLPQEVATFYWRLKSLHFRYCYRIQAQIFDRQFSVTCSEPPLQRLLAPPEFRHRAVDASLSLQTELEFLPGEVSQWDSECYGLRMNFGEVFVPHQDFALLSRPNGQDTPLDSYEANFFGVGIPFHLVTRFPSGTLTGSIESLMISGDFWEFSSHGDASENATAGTEVRTILNERLA